MTCLLGCIGAKDHFFKHFLEGNPAFTLLNHLLIHSLIIVYIFPALFFFTEIPLLGLRFGILFFGFSTFLSSLRLQIWFSFNLGLSEVFRSARHTLTLGR